MKDRQITIDMLDDDSKEFIEWSMALLEDPEYYKEYVLECTRKMKNFFARNPDEIRAMIKQKFIIGGHEHGSPAKYTQEQVEMEVEKEYIDAIGWPMVGDYAEYKRATRTTK